MSNEVVIEHCCKAAFVNVLYTHTVDNVVVHYRKKMPSNWYEMPLLLGSSMTWAQVATLTYV